MCWHSKRRRPSKSQPAAVRILEEQPSDASGCWTTRPRFVGNTCSPSLGGDGIPRLKRRQTTLSVLPRTALPNVMSKTKQPWDFFLRKRMLSAARPVRLIVLLRFRCTCLQLRPAIVSYFILYFKFLCKPRQTVSYIVLRPLF